MGQDSGGSDTQSVSRIEEVTEPWSEDTHHERSGQSSLLRGIGGSLDQKRPIPTFMHVYFQPLDQK